MYASECLLEEWHTTSRRHLNLVSLSYQTKHSRNVHKSFADHFPSISRRPDMQDKVDVSLRSSSVEGREQGASTAKLRTWCQPAATFLATSSLGILHCLSSKWKVFALNYVYYSDIFAHSSSPFWLRVLVPNTTPSNSPVSRRASRPFFWRCAWPLNMWDHWISPRRYCTHL